MRAVWLAAACAVASGTSSVPAAHAPLSSSRPSARKHISASAVSAVIKPPHNIETVSHQKAAGNGYLEGSPLYAHQQKLAKGPETQQQGIWGPMPPVAPATANSPHAGVVAGALIFGILCIAGVALLNRSFLYWREKPKTIYTGAMVQPAFAQAAPAPSASAPLPAGTLGYQFPPQSVPAARGSQYSLQGAPPYSSTLQGGPPPQRYSTMGSPTAGGGSPLAPAGSATFSMGERSPVYGSEGAVYSRPMAA